MSNQPEQIVERTSSSPVQTLDGAWFRRERERVAIGRKSLATKLGSTESRLHTLEWHEVARSLGHSSFAITAKHYAKADSIEVRKARRMAGSMHAKR